MALYSRRRHQEEEEESVFISMTDLMISVLFIIMILMAYFSLRTEPNKEVIDKSKYDQVVVELLVAKEEIKELKELIRQLQFDLRKAEETITELESELFRLTTLIVLKDQQIEELKKRLDSEIAKNSEYREEIATLNQYLDDKAKELLSAEELKRKILILTKEKETLSEENIDLRETIIILQRSLKEKDSDLKTILKLQRQIDDLMVKNQKLQKGNDDLKEEKLIMVPKKKLDEQKQLVEELREQIAKLLIQIEELEEKLKTRGIRTIQTVLDEIAQVRKTLLAKIQKRLEALDIEVEVKSDTGILRFQEKHLKFQSGSYTPDQFGLAVTRKLAQVLREELSCFTLGPNTTINEQCNPSNTIVDTIQIEGHTDDVPISKRNIQDNLALSTMRAAETLRIILGTEKSLEKYLNATNYRKRAFDIKSDAGQPVLAVSGYGDTRPVSSNQSSIGKAENRRIDLRFIMMTPRSLTEANLISRQIKRSIEESFNND